MKCEDCKWWERHKDADIKSGQCRKNAPRTIVSGCGVGENPEYEHDWAWTSPDDWCGEFQPK